MAIYDLQSKRWGWPRSWSRPQAQPLQGPYARNDVLARLQRLESVPGTTGPESLAIDADGKLYSGFDDGRIVSFDSDGRMLKILCNTGGRPLGMRFHPDGSLLVCDTELGLLRVSVPEGRVEQIAEGAGGRRFGFADDLDVTADGRFVYFSDASWKWHYKEDHLDIIEHGGHGRLLCTDLETGETRVLMSGLNFANGVTLGPDEAYVLVTETGGYRVYRYWLKGDRAGSHEVWIDNLPGFPDNIRFNGRDRFWVAIPMMRNPLLDSLAPLPLMRFLLLQYARYLPVPAKHAAIALGFDLDGNLVANLQDHGKGAYSFITQVLEEGDWLYCSSLHQKAVARIPLGSLELSAP